MEKIYEYIYQDNDIRDIEGIVIYLIKYLELDQYINNINIKDTSSNKYGNDNVIRTASYNFDSKDIYFYKDGIKKKIAFMLRKYLMYSDKDIVLYKNIVVLKIILHELEHANQNKVMDTHNSLSREKEIINIYNRFNIEYIYNKIIRNGYNDKIKAYEKAIEIFIQVYRDMYDCDPLERVANIRCGNKIIDLLKKIDCKEIYNMETKSLEGFYKRGYVFNNNELLSPLNEYIKVTGINDIKNISWYDKEESKSLSKVLKRYNKEERLLYGMPLTLEEYKNI